MNAYETMCPNNSTYKANKEHEISFQAMLKAPNPPSTWTPSNAQKSIGVLHNNS